MKVIFLDIDGVLQPYNSENRFEHDRKSLVSELSQKFHRDYSIYDEYDVAACYLDWDKDAVNRIKKILEETDSKIVVSSNWRNKKLEYKMRDFLNLWDMEKYWVGETDEYRFDEEYWTQKKEEYIKEERINYVRPVEILDYIAKHEDITNYVVIDDMNLGSFLEGHFVQTDNIINEEQTEECIKILNNKELFIRA